jgi:hypothetical protein
VFAVTVYVVPEPTTPVTDGAVSPEFTSEKSAESTPVTDSLNVTVQETDDAAAGVTPVRLIEETVGGVTSAGFVTTPPVRVMMLLGLLVQVSFVKPWKYALNVPTVPGAVTLNVVVLMPLGLPMSVMFTHVRDPGAVVEIRQPTELHALAALLS